jgi:hypothetical protein
VGADDEVDPVRDRRAARPPDAGDPAVLDADVGFDDAQHRVHDERAGQDDVELRRSGRLVPLRDAAAEVLGVAPDRLVAPCGPVIRDPDPEVRVAEPDPIAGRRAIARPVLPGGEPGHRSVPRAPA